MNIGKLYRFTFLDLEAARKHLLTWIGRCDINVSKTIADGFIDMWSNNPERVAAEFGGAIYKKANRL